MMPRHIDITGGRLSRQPRPTCITCHHVITHVTLSPPHLLSSSSRRRLASSKSSKAFFAMGLFMRHHKHFCTCSKKVLKASMLYSSKSCLLLLAQGRGGRSEPSLGAQHCRLRACPCFFVIVSSFSMLSRPHALPISHIR